MRIGIDMIALQSESRYRGIGRFAKNFLENLLQKGTEHEYILYVYDRMPHELVPKYGVQWINVWPGGPEHCTGLYNSVFGNPDKLDALLLLSPGESYVSRDVGVPRLYSIVYDLIPLLFKKKYLNDPWFEKLYYKYINAICEYDHLFTLSESARQDIIKELKPVCRGNVSVIGAATDPIFSPANDDSIMANPFFLHVGGDDARKGGEQVLKAFAKLPNRRDIDLIFSYWGSENHKEKLFRLAESLGIAENFTFRGYSSDDYIRKLYSQCLAFIFPSQYEGFGLPILEAMSCGASVIVGNNSSQVELVKDYGVITDPYNIESLSNIMYILSVDKELNNYIKEQCLERSKNFTWDKVVKKFLGIIKKPRLAVFSPMSPTPSGISDYTANLLPYLGEYFDITVYIDKTDKTDKTDKVNCNTEINSDWKTLSYTSFDPAKHDHILYHMGNSEYHRYMYPFIMKYPGTVVLHDFCLAGFHSNYDEIISGHFQRQIELAGEEYTKDISWAPEGRVVECINRGLYLNNEVVGVSKAIITHSEGFADGKIIHYVPFPKEPIQQTPRDEWKPSLKIVVPGLLSETKLNFLCLQAFAEVAYRGSILIFAGDGEPEQVERLKAYAREQGIIHRVKFTGRLTKEDYYDTIREADIGVVLRKPPTNGETSAALFDLLAAGIPTVVSNVGTFREIPDNAVIKINDITEGSILLVTGVLDILLRSESTRKYFGQAARKYVKQYHDPVKTAEIYSKIILKGMV